MKNKINLTDFSKHIFWDVDVNTLDINKNKRYIVQRVLEYGLLKDWLKLKSHFSIEEIAEIAKNISDLDRRAASYISTISKVPKEMFACYTTKPLNQIHWNF